MSFILHLGVVDLPYAALVPQEIRRVRTRAVRRGKRDWVEQGAAPAAPYGGKTTGDVATILEDKYHIMEVFAEDIGADKIADAFAHSAANALESLMMGGPANMTLTAEATSEIEAAFHQFISLQLMDGVVPGVPTKAALAGVNHRFAHPYAKANPERPSFRDTGTYMNSFKAWVD